VASGPSSRRGWRRAADRIIFTGPPRRLPSPACPGPIRVPDGLELRGMNTSTAGQQRQPRPGGAEGGGQDLAGLLARVARGDHVAFEAVYGQLAGPVYGIVRNVLRDPAQSAEVA
jgi:hypothetical protein